MADRTGGFRCVHGLSRTRAMPEGHLRCASCLPPPTYISRKVAAGPNGTRTSSAWLKLRGLQPAVVSSPAANRTMLSHVNWLKRVVLG